jgi:hypothetical protein
MGNPYVISAELDLATADLEQIVNQNRIESFREGVDADLRAMGKDIRWVPSSTIRRNLARAIATTNLPVISLDDRYVSSASQYLGISRGIDPLLNDDGYVARRGYPSIKEQLGKTSSLRKEVMLVDDVLFSGEMIAWLSDSFRPYGVRIGAVAVGIAIQEGIDKLALEGIEVQAAEVFDEVEDEICERDFAVVPGSGRCIDALAANALYFDTKNGKPDRWASISPSSTETFCVSSLKRSIDLLQRDVPMELLGKFLGYGTGGDAASQITTRLGEIS